MLGNTDELFVADGYFNRRIIVFDAATGAYKRHWGAYGRRPDDAIVFPPRPQLLQGPPSQSFNTPVHAVLVTNDDLAQVILSLGIGEAVVTVMNERGAPTPVAWTRLRAPESLMAAADPAAMQATVDASPRKTKYAEAIDRESAREKLAARLEAGAQKAEQEPPPQKAAQKRSAPKKAAPKKKEEESMVTQVVQSSAFKDFMRTAAREIARGMFNTARR